MSYQTFINFGSCTNPNILRTTDSGNPLTYSMFYGINNSFFTWFFSRYN